MSSEALAQPEVERKRKLERLLLLNTFNGVLQHVINLQSEIALFTAACGGDVAATARSLVNTSSITGVAGLLVNQVGGKLSDALGRKPFFLAGPIINILVGLLVFLRPSNLRILFITRILKLIGTTFSGTVMTGAAVCDVCADADLDAFNSKVPILIGMAVVSGPFIESLVGKLSGGRHRFTYLALAIVSFAQLVASGAMPETLPRGKRISLSEFSASLSSINPFSFLKIYTGRNERLKSLVTITTLQNFLEGRCTSDVFQMWARNNLKWSAETIRNYLSLWGGMSVASGFLQFFVAQKMSARAYTLFSSLFVGCGVSLEGAAPRGIFMWLSLPLLMPGINAGTSLKLKRLQAEIATEEGIGQGEFSAWVNNARGLSSALAPWIYGQWYAWCEKHGVYSGSVWPLAGFLGSFLPLALFMRMPSDARTTAVAA